MSIPAVLGQLTAPTTQPTTSLHDLLLMAPLGLVALVMAVVTGVFRRDKIVGPARLTNRDSLGPLVAILGGGVVIWIIGGGLVFAALTQAGGTATHPTSQRSAVEMSTGSMALATSVPALAAGAFMIGLNAVLRPGGVRELGLAPRGAARGILRGLVGSAIAVPLIFFVAQVTEYIWEFFHYAHPREHDLLKLMGESTNPVVFALFVLSAVLIAPVFEELLFRGHLQTVIAYAIARGLGQIPGPAARGFQVVTGEPDVAPSMAEPVPAPVPSSPPASTRWAAILVTSLLFAAVHPAWTWPPILILALCLGYAYERTGNLWTSMTMHAMFNTTSTVIYLLFVR